MKWKEVKANIKKFLKSFLLHRLWARLNEIYPHVFFDEIIVALEDGKLSDAEKRLAGLRLAQIAWDGLGSRIPWPWVAPWVEGRLAARVETLKMSGKLKTGRSFDEATIAAAIADGDPTADEMTEAMVEADKDPESAV